MISKDHTGDQRLEKELPWLTPESILWLDNNLTKDMTVLEFGSGGSTLFFSKRTKFVTSFESEGEWFDKVFETLVRRRLTNINVALYSNKENLLPIFPTTSFNCILIDNNPEYSKVTRDWILQKAVSLLTSPKILILDNYNLGRLFFPHSRLLTNESFIKEYGLEGCRTLTFNHPKWLGKGTKIYYV